MEEREESYTDGSPQDSRDLARELRQLAEIVESPQGRVYEITMSTPVRQAHEFFEYTIVVKRYPDRE